MGLTSSSGFILVTALSSIVYTVSTPSNANPAYEYPSPMGTSENVGQDSFHPLTQLSMQTPVNLFSPSDIDSVENLRDFSASSDGDEGMVSSLLPFDASSTLSGSQKDIWSVSMTNPSYADASSYKLNSDVQYSPQIANVRLKTPFNLGNRHSFYDIFSMNDRSNANKKDDERNNNPDDNNQDILMETDKRTRRSSRRWSPNISNTEKNNFPRETVDSDFLEPESDENIVYQNLATWLDGLGIRENANFELMDNDSSELRSLAPAEVDIDHADPDEPLVSPKTDEKSLEDLDPYSASKADLELWEDLLLDSSNIHDDEKDVNKREDVSIERRNLHTPKLMALLKARAASGRRAPVQTRPRTQRLYNLEEEVQRRQHNRRPVETYTYTTSKPTCEPEEDGTAPMTCPSDRYVCLYDTMICDGKQDCSGGDDETFAICVLRHWTFRWLRKLNFLFPSS